MVYHLRFTTFFRFKGGQQFLAAAAAAAAAATDRISAYRHISFNIDPTSPKLLWLIALMMYYNPTKFGLPTLRWRCSVAVLLKSARDRRSRARATSGPQEPCARDQGTTGGVRARPGDHRSRARATSGPQEPCARDQGSTGAVRARRGVHRSRARATRGPQEPCARDQGTAGAYKLIKLTTISVLLRSLD